jgi:hypothetical protein
MFLLAYCFWSQLAGTRLGALVCLFLGAVVVRLGFVYFRGAKQFAKMLRRRFATPGPFGRRRHPTFFGRARFLFWSHRIVGGEIIVCGAAIVLFGLLQLARA